VLGWQGLIFPSGYQHDLGEELHLTSELLKPLLGRSVHDNERLVSRPNPGGHWLCAMK
jgi:hypothetical protein